MVRGVNKWKTKFGRQQQIDEKGFESYFKYFCFIVIRDVIGGFGVEEWYYLIQILKGFFWFLKKMIEGKLGDQLGECCYKFRKKIKVVWIIMLVVDGDKWLNF